MKREQTEQHPTHGEFRMLKAYMLTVILCLCLTAAALGVAVAGNNTQKLSLGREQARVVLSQQEDRLSLHTGDMQWSLPAALPRDADSLLRMAPPPLCTAHWVAQCIRELLQ